MHTDIENQLISTEERMGAGFIHLGAMALAFLSTWFVGVGGMVVAGIAYLLINRNKYAFAKTHASEAFNFNFTMFILTLLACTVGVLITIIVAVITLGVGLLIIIPVALVIALSMMVIWVIASIMAGVAGFQGKEFRYPFTWRILD